eukprot:393895_1
MKRSRHQSGSEGNGRKRHHRDKGCDVAAAASKDTSTKIPNEEGDDASQPLLSCAICFEDTLNEKGSIVCGHSFCFKCIHTWSKTENTCPLCKKRFSSIDKVMVCPGGASSKRKRSSVPSSSLKRRIPVRRRNQYTPTPSSAIPASFFHGMGVVHPLMVLTDILMPRGGSGHLFGVVSANGHDSDMGWVSTSNAEGFALPRVSFGGHPQDLDAIMEMGSSFTHRHSLAPFLMVRNAAPLHPPAGTSASNPVELDLNLTRSESTTSTTRQRRILQRNSNGAPPIRRSSGGNSRHGLNSVRVPRLRSPPR